MRPLLPGLHARLWAARFVRVSARLYPPGSVYVGADSSGIDPVLYRFVRSHLGKPDIAFLGMEGYGAPLTWLYQGLLTQPVSKKMSDSRELSGSNAAQAADIVSELNAGAAHIYAMGEED